MCKGVEVEANDTILRIADFVFTVTMACAIEWNLDLPQKDSHDEQGDEHSRRTEGHRTDRPSRLGAQEHLGNVLAVLLGGIRHRSLRAHQALCLVVWMTNLCLDGMESRLSWHSIIIVTHFQHCQGQPL